MRSLFGMILGAVLTIGAAFAYDSWNSDNISSSDVTAAAQHRQMVNWEVVGENWRSVRQHARDTWTALSRKLSG